MTRVAVVGAGFSGLAAGDALVRNGVEATVFEARDRVGGRVWSRHLPNAATVEMGAEFFEDDHTELHALVRRFGLTTVPRGMSYSEREPRGVDTTVDALREGARTARRALVEREQTSPTSVRDFIDGLALPAAIREAIVARVELSAAYDASRLDASVLLHVAGSFDGVESRRILGGNDAIARGLAADLDGRVLLSTPVLSIAAHDTGPVRVRTNQAEAEFDAVVVAVPPPALRRIDFDPLDPIAADLRSLPFADAAKLFVPLASPATPGAVMSVPERYWSWTARGADGSVEPAVSCFAGSADALQKLAVADGPETWLASLRRLRPDLDLDPAGTLLSTWWEPWSGGAYSVWRADRPLPQGPWRAGRVVYCGEHTAGAWASLMEGALRSGLRAASAASAAASTPWRGFPLMGS
jgi:monoamine oxidase